MLKKPLTAVILIALIISGSYYYLTEESLEEVYINHVIDGDTIRIANGESVRFIGIDTPEIDWDNNEAEYYGWEARDYLQQKIQAKNVRLKYDQEKEDHYGRLLAYVYLNGLHLNQVLLENGYATLMIVEPNNKYETEFKKAAEEARRAQKGLWNKVEEFSSKLPLLDYQTAQLFIGEKVIVEGEIVNTAKTDAVTYLNFSDDYHNTLSIVIFNRNLNKFAYEPDQYLKDKRIRVLGTIEIYQSAPQIIVSDPHYIMVEY
ncbi:thermonuclease family protein [Halanaerobium hydrogeniformans]|uniref:Nuclease (SNase domain-containing protein) n=1 Tax=Halanaerobium hydrogeniformans TaxID=656519 RepID=E4RMT3_HALHG|nr:thermonuclease family protein [Halanaerobium hydrogeniformans]ADQ14150.1 nuclease (SNase domain-containing protein) [Halanaerobium hydrogeniformans]